MGIPTDMEVECKYQKINFPFENMWGYEQDELRPFLKCDRSSWSMPSWNVAVYTSEIFKNEIHFFRVPMLKCKYEGITCCKHEIYLWIVCEICIPSLLFGD